MNINHEVLTKDEALKVVTVDAQLQPKDVQKKYVQANQFSYYVAANTWLLQVKVADEWAMLACKDHLLRCGLIQTIKDLDGDATRLVQGKEPISQIGGLINGLRIELASDYFALTTDYNFFRDDLASKLQLMRYLKRFSPQYNVSIEKKSLSSFLAVENANKLKQRKEYPVWLIDMVRDEITDLLDWDEVCSEIEHIDPREFIIPSGATYEGLHTLGDKLATVCAENPEWFDQPFGLPYVFPFYEETADISASRVQAVPKSYKAARIIAMEPVSRQSKAAVVMNIIKRHLPDCVDITNQTRNQELAWLGSRAGSLATLDASNASDRISKTLGRQVLPARFRDLIWPLLSEYTELSGERRYMQMLSTSGHELTFVLETVIYYGIAAAASSCYERFTGDTTDIVSVYGDDVILSSKVAELACEFYDFLGLKINVDKSYWSGPYRESCGKEYMDGIDVTSIYFPRFPLIGKFTETSVDFGKKMFRDTYRGKVDDCTTMLVDLEKRILPVSYEAGMFLWALLKEGRPRITSSAYFTQCNDNWAAMDMAPSFNPVTRVYSKLGIKPNPDVVRMCETQKHSYASIQYTLDGLNPPEFQVRCFEIYKYQNFLRTGPTYATELDRLLGVTEPPLSITQAFGEGKLVWRYEIR